VVGRLHVRCAGLWPPLPDLQRRRRLNREALHIEVDTSITSARLVRIFEQLQRDHGLPQVLRTDNGPKFLGEAFVQWAKANAMAIQYIQPGKLNQNTYMARFNRTFREESWTNTCCPH
jgi:putative transposase